MINLYFKTLEPGFLLGLLACRTYLHKSIRLPGAVTPFMTRHSYAPELRYAPLASVPAYAVTTMLLLSDDLRVPLMILYLPR